MLHWKWENDKDIVIESPFHTFVIRTAHSDKNHQTTVFHVIDHNSEHYLLIAKMLLEYGVDINVADSDGNTVLHSVLLAQHTRNRGTIVQDLVAHCHADFLVIKNNDGKTARDIGLESYFVLPWNTNYDNESIHHY
jgi:ankyrin repeat protein